MRSSTPLLAALALFVMATLTACETTPKTQAGRQSLVDESQAALNRFERDDPSLKDFLANAYGYATFPDVGKGGVIVGGAYGKGVVYEKGNLAGYADLTQASVGAQLGGATFAEVIVFQTPEALNRFKNNQLAFTADATAVGIKAGAAKTAKYDSGVAVFTEAKGGLYAGVSVGGQKFTFVPLSQGDARTSATTMP